MSNNQGPSNKIAGAASAPSNLPQQAPTGPAASNNPQRGSGTGGGGGGGGSGGRGPSSAPRNQQSSRKGHRNHRRPQANHSGYHNDYDEQIAMTSSTSRRGTSITHLINWDVAVPRPQTYSEFRPRTTRRNPTWGLGSGYHAVDKARYVHSNYRFIVNPSGDYRAHAVDADVTVPWNLVLQILASAQTQRPNCPICLSSPVAPRMSKCGHIFCLPCLARYMASVDEKAPDKKVRSKKCVICTDNVYMNDIRPVRFFVGQESYPPKDGHDVVLRLVMRKQGTTLALPRGGGDPPSDLNEVPWYFASEVMDYARIMKGTEDYMLEQFEREIADLEAARVEDGLMFSDDGIWHRKAMNMIRTQMEVVKGIGNAPAEALNTPSPKEKDIKKERPPIVFQESADAPELYLQHAATTSHSSISSPAPPPDPSIPVPANIAPPPLPTPLATPHPTLATTTDDSAYYFYQALPHYYLAPLDIRILKSAFGSFASFPSHLLPRVENVTTGHTVDDDLRKRARYLAHLPYGCEVGFLECDWSGIIPDDVLQKFIADINKRRKRKRDKESKEERDRIRAEHIEAQERWEAASQTPPIPLREEFGAADFVALASNGMENLSITSGSPPPGEGVAVGAHGGTTVWGTRAVNNPEVYRADAEGDSGWLEEEMLAQIAMEESLGEGHTHGRVPSHGKGQKKKKFKKVTLMTNGGKRGA